MTRGARWRCRLPPEYPISVAGGGAGAARKSESRARNRADCNRGPGGGRAGARGACGCAGRCTSDLLCFRRFSHGGPAQAQADHTRDQAEALFDEADADRSGFIDISEFAQTWTDFDAQYGMTNMINKKRGFLSRLTSSKSMKKVDKKTKAKKV